MSEHICIRNPEYVAGTFARPEVGVFTQTSVGRPPVPWGRISAGETVWMKWTGGPVVARATVSGYRQIESCTPAQLRDAVAGFASRQTRQLLGLEAAEVSWACRLSRGRDLAGRTHCSVGS